jgi:hypothetical protein
MHVQCEGVRRCRPGRQQPCTGDSVKRLGGCRRAGGGGASGAAPAGPFVVTAPEGANVAAAADATAAAAVAAVATAFSFAARSAACGASSCDSTKSARSSDCQYAEWADSAARFSEIQAREAANCRSVSPRLSFSHIQVRGGRERAGGGGKQARPGDTGVRHHPRAVIGGGDEGALARGLGEERLNLPADGIGARPDVEEGAATGA